MMSGQYTVLKNPPALCYRIVCVALLALLAAGGVAAHYMDLEGHWITGMGNRVVWGLPHVFAILLILGASGVLNIASIATVFGHASCRGWARLSALLALCLLAGGLAVLVLDLGRPDRLVVAMTHYNLQSVFAWNVFLYTGFALVVIAYLWAQFEPRQQTSARAFGLLALCWRFVLTAGTGAIFGFLVGRPYYDSAMMIPVFIVLSLVLGTAVFLCVCWCTGCWSGIRVRRETVSFLTRFLGWMIALELFLVTAFHLTLLYAPERAPMARFVLLEGGLHTVLFWAGQVFLGALLPLFCIFRLRAHASANGALGVSGAVIAGAACQVYVVVIAGQAYPQTLFPGKRVTSTFFDGEIVQYCPSVHELMLGLGGVAVAAALLLAALRVLPFLPVPDRASAGG